MGKTREPSSASVAAQGMDPNMLQSHRHAVVGHVTQPRRRIGGSSGGTVQAASRANTVQTAGYTARDEPRCAKGLGHSVAQPPRPDYGQAVTKRHEHIVHNPAKRGVDSHSIERYGATR